MKKILLIALMLCFISTVAYAEFGNTGNRIYTNQKTVTTAGTAVVLTSDTVSFRGISIVALPSNTLNVYIGSSATANSVWGHVVSGDREITLPVTKANSIYVDADLAGEGVSWVGVLK